MDSVGCLLKAHAMVGTDPEGAEAICRDIASSEPENGFAFHLLGVLLLKRRQAASAQATLRRAAALRPGNLDTRIALAEAFACDGADERAARELSAVLTAQPRHAGALAALAMVRLRLGEAAAALALAERARDAAPDAVEPLVALGTAMSALRQPAAAREVLQEAIARAPAHADAHLNLGNVLLDLDHEAAAEFHLRRAVALQPASAEAWASLGFLLAGMDCLAEAIAACDTAIALRPDFAQAHWNRSFARLRAGDFAEGWADYEWRHRHPRFGRGAHVLPGQEWNGGDLAGVRLLVNATQGLGDTIQLARYLPLLAARQAQVTLICPRPLMSLLAQLPARLIERGDDLPAYDMWIDQMSLPGRFGTRLDSIPAPSGFLCSEAKPWRPTVHLRVGLVCAGNPLHSNDFRRSMAPQQMAPLREVSGVEFVSLQVGPASRPLARLFDLPDESAALVDMAATARIVAGLDLVIAVDTAVAHLAGALGVPVWILIPRAPDWRWPAGHEHSPWYASARLFRQPRAGDWTSVIARTAQALRALGNNHRQEAAIPSASRIL